MRKLTKKLLAVTLTTATLLSGFAIAPTQKADAKAKNYNAYLMFANKKFSCVNMNEKVASTKKTSVEEKIWSTMQTRTATSAATEGN